jgi:hypothetical protein
MKTTTTTTTTANILHAGLTINGLRKELERQLEMMRGVRNRKSRWTLQITLTERKTRA